MFEFILSQQRIKKKKKEREKIGKLEEEINIQISGL